MVVGGRLAGTAAASALARAGRDVVVLERGHFPSDTLSTHVLFAGGVEEMRRMGAFERIEALDPSYMREVEINFEDGTTVREPWGACGETDFVLCIPRPLQDALLVDVVREQGVDVRERSEFLDVTWRGGRVGGVRYRDPDGRGARVAREARDRRRRPPLLRRRPGRRVASVPRVEERARARLPLLRRPPRRHPGQRDAGSVAGRDQRLHGLPERAAPADGGARDGTGGRRGAGAAAIPTASGRSSSGVTRAGRSGSAAAATRASCARRPTCPPSSAPAAGPAGRSPGTPAISRIR